MKKLIIICAAVVSLSLVGCTKNVRAQRWGGSSTETLPSNTKLVNITWKNENLWLITRPMRTNELPETYIFREVSNFGFMEGKITIIESK